MKRVVCILTAFIILTVTVSGIAFEGDEHDEILEKILFGKIVLTSSERKVEYFSNLYTERQSLRALELASFLTVDLYSATRRKGINTLPALRSYRIGGLPQNIEEIIYDDGPLHGRYSHLGWNHDYGGEDQVRWETRKKILLETTEKVFNFSFLPTRIFGYDKRCDSFSALVYYIHIIADYQAGEDHEINLMPLAAKNPNSKNPDVFYELIYHLRILFDDEDSYTYGAMMGEIQELAESARKELAMNGSIDTQQYANELIDKLENNIYKLLRNEPFFKKVFY